jgi:hypothetical protein
VILEFLKSFLNLNDHIKAALSTTCVLLIFTTLYFSELSNKPVRFEEPSLTTEGTLVWVDGNQRGSSLIIRDENTKKLIRFFVLPTYTELPRGFSKSRGHHITVTHFGGLVTACNLASVGLCIPKCSEAYECKVKNIEHSARVLKYTSITVFVFLVGMLVHYYFRKKSSRSD